MIRRLILSKQSYLQLSVVVFGTLFGLLMVMSSLQLYKDIKSIVDAKKELISAQFLVVNKPVSILNTLSGNAAVFSEAEIEAFKSLKSVEKVGTFKANRFRAQTGFQFQDKTMMTDMFFESVPDEFLDVKTRWGLRRFECYRTSRLLHKSRHIPNRHRDRKSTRLNSSHITISYAVVCLK